ncbi:hypothetical protein [Pseudobacillus badius]|uniref:hypothetical protein n=1 Tax=Bacillus badius TaxID=1455 RepID=UPI0024A3923E|nr:hypothetical protein [Bacillus badius]GLY11890.1 hypothetical protein Bbad01_31060 [Bacillus badius]
MLFEKLLWFQKKNNEAESLSTLLYSDRLNDEWEQQNFTKENLNYSLESLSIIDKYINRMVGTDFCSRNLITLSTRIGFYVGEVIRKQTGSYFNWYEYDDIFIFLSEEELDAHDNYYDIVKLQEVLYNRKTKVLLLPLYFVFQLLIKDSASDHSVYEYGRKMIRTYGGK